LSRHAFRMCRFASVGGAKSDGNCVCLAALRKPCFPSTWVCCSSLRSRTSFFLVTQIDVVWFPEGAGGDKFMEKIFYGPLHLMAREALKELELTEGRSTAASTWATRTVLGLTGVMERYFRYR
jgi:hypothetical protein